MTSMTGMAGGIIGGIGTWLSAEAQASVYQANAKNAERDALAARQAAAAEAEDIAYEADFVKGKQRAMSAAFGFVPDEGTGKALLEEAERRAAKAESRAVYQGEVDYAKFMYEHELYRRMAGWTRLFGIIGGWSQALSGGAVQNPSTGRQETTGNRTESAYQEYRAGERSYGAANRQQPEPGEGLGTTGTSGADEAGGGNDWW